MSKSRTVFSENFGIIGLIRTNFAVSCIISYWWSQCDNVPMLDVQKYRVIIIKRKRKKIFSQLSTMLTKCTIFSKQYFTQCFNQPTLDSLHFDKDTHFEAMALKMFFKKQFFNRCNKCNKLKDKFAHFLPKFEIFQRHNQWDFFAKYYKLFACSLRTKTNLNSFCFKEMIIINSLLFTIL